jgi:hypothetical protein
MLTSLAFPIIILCAVAAWTAFASLATAQRTQRQLQTLERGVACRATVVGIQRPFLLDHCTRIYFEFMPHGSEHPVRCCHIERGDPAEVAIALPVTGSQVQVSYLPEQPESAVIGSLLRNGAPF